MPPTDQDGKRGIVFLEGDIVILDEVSQPFASGGRITHVHSKFFHVLAHLDRRRRHIQSRKLKFFLVPLA